ncbi:MAG: DUF5691 domain-containing protein [Pseudomonadota bacterium]
MDSPAAQIDALKARWMTGATTSGVGPEEWQGLDELSLLALAGQFARVATHPGTSAPLTPRPDIPALPLKPLPEDLRPQFRRLRDDKQFETLDTVRFIAARGYGVHPVDWMPRRTADSLPPAYEVWRDWLNDALPAEAEDHALTAETWDMVAPSRRYADLARLHRDDPEAARALITALAPTLAADQRLRMLQCVQAALTDGDADLLQGFDGDRSSKVQTFVKTQLARLGTGPQSDADAAAEIPDYIDVAKAGILSRKRIIEARKLKTPAQKKSRAQVFAKMSLAGLADVLKMTPDEVIDAWSFGEGTDEIIALVAATGTDAQVSRLAERAIEATEYTPLPLMERLDTATRRAFGLQVLKHDDLALPLTRQWIAEPEGDVSWDALSSLPFKKITSALTESKNANTEAQAAAGVMFLGLIADRDAATRIVDTLVAGGVLPVDPRLTLLRLNAAL